MQRLSFDIAKRYSAVGHTASKDTTSSFYLLLDLMTFFDAYHGEKFDDALDIITKLKIVPLAQVCYFLNVDNALTKWSKE